jgi:hypothetical protein
LDHPFAESDGYHFRVGTNSHQWELEIQKLQARLEIYKEAKVASIPIAIATRNAQIVIPVGQSLMHKQPNANVTTKNK